MTTLEITNLIKSTQKQVNTLLRMKNIDGDITININISSDNYNSFEKIQDQIENEVIIDTKTTELRIGLFYKWIRI